MSSKQKITVIGLGAMGATIARLYLEQGHEVTIWNRSADKAAPLVAQGAVLSAST
ncbi:NAD(P)-binding domain-containing protein, partial [Variovorax sp. CT11-76]